MSSACALHDLLTVVIVESTCDMTDSIWDGSVLVVGTVVFPSCASWASIFVCEATVACSMLIWSINCFRKVISVSVLGSVS